MAEVEWRGRIVLRPVMPPAPCILCRAVLGWEGDGCAPAGRCTGRRLTLLARTGIAWESRHG